MVLKANYYLKFKKKTFLNQQSLRNRLQVPGLHMSERELPYVLHFRIVTCLTLVPTPLKLYNSCLSYYICSLTQIWHVHNFQRQCLKTMICWSGLLKFFAKRNRQWCLLLLVLYMTRWVTCLLEDDPKKRWLTFPFRRDSAYFIVYHFCICGFHNSLLSNYLSYKTEVIETF